jgi:ABC-type multidrug transport system ATPase subunit
VVGWGGWYRPATMINCLALRGVSKTYSAGIRGCSATVRVLHDLDLDVCAGEIVAVHVMPAAGTTTLLMCAAGLLRPDRGSISWFGSSARRDRSAPQGIAYVSDRPFPYAFLSVQEAVEYAAIARDLPLSDHAARVSEVLTLTNLSAIAHRRVDALDAGQVSRLALANAFLARPRLLLIDDIGSGCDASAARDIITLVRGCAIDGAGVVIAGRLVPWFVANDTAVRQHVPTRCVSLSGGRIEPIDAAPPSPMRNRAAPLAPARVAEWSGSSAAQNEAR